MTGRHHLPGGDAPTVRHEPWPSAATRDRAGAIPARPAPARPAAGPGRTTAPSRAGRRLRVTLAGVVPVVLVAAVTVAGLLGTGVLGGVAPADQRVDDHVPVPTFASGPTAGDAPSSPVPARWYGTGTGIAPTTTPVAARETRAAAVADGAVQAATARIAEDRRAAQERAAAAAAAEERRAAALREQRRAEERARQQADARRRVVPPTATPTPSPAPTTTPAAPPTTAPGDDRARVTPPPSPTADTTRTEGVVCRVVRFVLVPC